jgi:hypothetical protein
VLGQRLQLLRARHALAQRVAFARRRRRVAALLARGL